MKPDVTPFRIEPPRNIFWIGGGLLLFLGLCLAGFGLWIDSASSWRIFGLVMIGLGGMMFGVGVRILGSCYVGLRKSRRSMQATPPAR